MADLTALSKRDLASKLLALCTRLHLELAMIDGLKGELRKRAADGGFHEIVPELGSVKVSSGSGPRLRGIMPTLDPVLFLASADTEREQLLKSGLVTMAEDWTKGSSPAVTVKLA